MTNAVDYGRPYHWWGPGPAPRAPLPLLDLLDNGTIGLELAATLWASLAGGRSLTIIGGPSGLGKSTLLHALFPSLPPERDRLYLRGCYETFKFQREPAYSPGRTTLLVNEISPHLPIYLWGPAVRRTLVAGEDGCQILATAHGRSVVEFVGSLTGSPLRIPTPLLAATGLVALLEPTPDGARRQVTEVWQLSAAQYGVAIDRLLPGELPTGTTADQVAVARAAVLSIAAPD